MASYMIQVVIPNFVTNFKNLGKVVPEKSLTKKNNWRGRKMDKQREQ